MEQLLLNIKEPTNKTFDNFIVGNNNECLDALRKFVSSNIYQFIYLWGEIGCGKSHLANAVSSNKIIIIEDIELKNNNEQIKIFNLYNEHKSSQKKLLVTGSNSPNNMNLRPDLASRLIWGLVYQIKPLTDLEKKDVLKKYALDHGFHLKKEVIDYCLNNLKRDLHTLMNILYSLDEWSLKTKRPITIPLLKDILLRQNIF
jgi:DnaA family protein